MTLLSAGTRKTSLGGMSTNTLQFVPPQTSNGSGGGANHNVLGIVQQMKASQ